MTITAIANEPAFCLEVEAWCKRSGHELVQIDNTEGPLMVEITKKG
jgi:TusA-related sulfurtransferase